MKGPLAEVARRTVYEDASRKESSSERFCAHPTWRSTRWGAKPARMGASPSTSEGSPQMLKTSMFINQPSVVARSLESCSPTGGGLGSGSG